ncbi:MAG: site-specific DNA-methyltransferase [Bacteroidales bacterium]|nr:site-specific DNA-methyltransferase [Bacteroidales bacterium]MBN2836379.1 site-specific DNA-methyltransferase [Candidatus Delongbacteria bacterium]
MSEINKKTMGTPDLNEERLETLKGLFPDLFTVEGKLNPDELKKIIDPDLVKETERFEFKWFGKSEAKRTAFTPSKATLVYDDKRSVNPEFADGNMIIEGENLETLKCLLSAYRGRIKCIYIDPPYNTGKDFVYSDKWDESKEEYWEHIGITENGVKVDSNSDSTGRYHSNWINLIFSRLLISRQLLKEDGFIFISIDICEAHHLKKICDEIFGENNFIGNISRATGTRMGTGSRGISRELDYILVYSKDNSSLLKKLPMTKDEIALYNEEDENGKFLTRSLRRTGGENRREDRPSMFYPVKDPDGNDVLPLAPEGWESRWVCGRDTYNELVSNNMIVWKKVKKKDEEKWQVYQKHYLNEEGKESSDLWTDEDGNKKGTKELNALFEGRKIFDNPKPTEIIKKILNSSTDRSDIVLDFFAGSGTTGHSVIDLNKENSTDRKFILIQLPETTSEKSEAFKAGYKKISDITIERNKRVIEKIEKQQAESDPSLFDDENNPFQAGFKVYKLSKSNFPRVDFSPDPEKTEEENLALLNKYIDEKEGMFLSMIEETLVFDEVLLKNGFMLNYSKIKEDTFSKNAVFRVKDKFKECLICLEMTIEKETLKDLEGFKDSLFICLERALDTTIKWNLKHLLGDNLVAV